MQSNVIAHGDQVLLQQAKIDELYRTGFHLKAAALESLKDKQNDPTRLGPHCSSYLTE